MTRFFFVFIAILTFTYTKAQVLDTTLFELPVFSDTVSKLDEAKGWLLQNDGVWVSGNNKIPNDKTILSSKNDDFKIGKENFSSIEFTPFLFEKNRYILMVVYYNDGYYELPILKADWRNRKAAFYYVFERVKLRFLIPDASTINKPYSISLNVNCSGYIDLTAQNINIKEIVAENLIKIKQKQIVNYANLVFSIYNTKKEEEEKILFKLIKTYTKKTLYEYYLQPDKQESIFKKSYFETDKETFNSFVTGCLNPSETYLKPQIINAPDTNFGNENYKSNINEVMDRLKNFGKKYEDLKEDTSNFYSALKISKYADTVAATSYIKPNRSVKTDKKGKTKDKNAKQNDINVLPKENLLDIIIADSNKIKLYAIEKNDSIVDKLQLMIDSIRTISDDTLKGKSDSGNIKNNSSYNKIIKPDLSKEEKKLKDKNDKLIIKQLNEIYNNSEIVKSDTLTEKSNIVKLKDKDLKADTISAEKFEILSDKLKNDSKNKKSNSDKLKKNIINDKKSKQDESKIIWDNSQTVIADTIINIAKSDSISVEIVPEIKMDSLVDTSIGKDSEVLTNKDSLVLKTDILKPFYQSDTVTHQIIFRIQIGTSDIKKTDSQIKSIYKLNEDIYTTYVNNIYKYSIGNYKKFNDAKVRREALSSEKEFKTAFVVAFKDDKPVSVAEALKISEKK